MPTRKITLASEQDAFIEEMLKASEYSNASEAMRDAIDALKLERLRQSIDAGIAALARGDYEDVDEAELEAWLDRVGDPARA